MQLAVNVADHVLRFTDGQRQSRDNASEACCTFVVGTGVADLMLAEVVWHIARIATCELREVDWIGLHSARRSVGSVLCIDDGADLRPSSLLPAGHCRSGHSIAGDVMGRLEPMIDLMLCPMQLIVNLAERTAINENLQQLI